jgi:hypothetical protein
MSKHMDKLDRARKLKGLQALYLEEDLLSTMDIIEHVKQGHNISTPDIGQESFPTQEDQKMAAQDSDASSPHSTNQNESERRTRDNTKMERIFAQLAENTKIQMRQQEERHAKEIADTKQANRYTHNLFTTKTTTPQNKTMNDHRITAHFNTMTKASYTLFDGTPENWPIFEHHLLMEAENPTITWNHNITHFQPDNDEKHLNFLERYFDLPEDTSLKLELDLANDTITDIVQVNSKLYKLHCLKTKLKNCFTPDLTLDIDTSMPPGLPNKDGHLFFIKLVLHTFPDKEAHERIMYEYILKLEITKSSHMESFQRELRRHTI